MADRTVTYRLSADIGSFRAQMAQAGQSVKKAADDMTAATKEGAKFRHGLDQLGGAAGKIGLVAAAGLTAAVVTAANFDEAMSHVQAATMESASNMDRLRDAAIQAGADTAFSASEAAAGIENLAKAGVSTADILDGGLSGALDLAAAGTIGVADAAEAAAMAMTQFSLTGEDVPHIADLLAAAAGKATGDVSDFTQALNQSGIVANQVGLSIEETTGGLAAFASAGLLGSDAGTSFKTMLGALTPNSEKAKKAMSELGITAYDAQGNFVGLAEFAGTLQTALADMTDEQRQATLETIFGSDAVRAASVLYNQGEAGIRDWITAVDDQGYAAETAATKLDNLKGDLEAFKGSLETALIGTGEGAQGPLRSLVQTLTDVVNAYNDLPEAAKTATAALAGLTAAVGGGAWFGVKIVNGVAAARGALSDLGVTSDSVKGVMTKGLDSVTGRARAAGQAFEEMSLAQVGLRSGAGIVGGLALAYNDLDQSADSATRTIGEFTNIAGGALMGFAVGGPVGAAIGGGIAAISALAGAIRDGDDTARAAAAGADFYAASLDGVASAADEAARKQVALRLEEQGVLENLQQLGISSQDYVSAILGDSAAVDVVSGQLATLRTELTGLSEVTSSGSLLEGTFDLGGSSLIEQAQAVNGVRDANAALLPVLDSVASAFGIESRAVASFNESQGRTASAVEETSGAVDDNTGALDDNTGALGANADAANEALEAMRGIRAESVRAANAQLNYQAALLDARDAAAEHDKVLSKSGKLMAGVRREGIDAKRALNDLAAAWNGLSDEEKNSEGARRRAIDAFADAAVKMGMSEEAARDYARELMEIPPERVTDVVLKGVPAAEAALNDLARDRYATVWVRHKSAGGQSAPGNDPKLATGGPVYGPGTATSDSIPAYLSNGEYVIRAAAVEKYGRGMFDQLNTMRFAAGGLVSMAAQPIIAPASPTQVSATVMLAEQDVQRIAAAVREGSLVGTAEGMANRGRALTAAMRTGVR